MKKKLRKVLFPIFLSVVCGAICGRMVYDIYDKKLVDDIGGDKIYLIQAGAYSTYDNMVSHTMLSNYVYYEDDGLYKSIIGITEDYNNIEKIKNTYDNNVIVSEFFSKDKELNLEIKKYDKMMSETSNVDEIKRIVGEMLELYKGKNTTLLEVES